MTFLKNMSALLLLSLLPGLDSGLLAAGQELKILGWVENAKLIDPAIELKTKLDTGAETSSLDAQVIKKFRKDGKRWIRFRIADRENGQEYTLVRERVRTIGVVQHDGSTQRRPVVVMNVCIAGQVLSTEVSLIDRSEFIYPLLLGRRAMTGFALVDPSATYLSSPDCQHETVEPVSG